MDDPELLSNQAAPPTGMVATWELWVPGGVWYVEDGSRIYRSYTPGAAMNRLTIAANGTYEWATQQGRLQEIKPWFALEGQRYFAVQMAPGMRYMARYDAAKDKIDLFFWGVGGHAASGTRSRR